MVAFALVALCVRSEGLVAPELVALLGEVSRSQRYSIEFDAGRLANLGEDQLAFQLIESSTPQERLTTLYHAVRESGKAGGLGFALSSYQKPSEPILRSITRGQIEDVRAAVAYVRACDKTGETTGVEIAPSLATLLELDPKRTKVVDLAAFYMRLGRYELSSFVIADCLTDEEFAPNLGAFTSSMWMEPTETNANALLSHTVERFTPSQLFKLLRSTHDERVVGACERALMDGRKLALSAFPSNPSARDVLDVAALLLLEGKRSRSLAVIDRYSPELSDAAYRDKEGFYMSVERGLVSLGANDVLRTVAARHEAVGDRIVGQGGRTLLSDAALTAYLNAYRMYLFAGDATDGQRVGVKAQRLSPDGDPLVWTQAMVANATGRHEESLDLILTHASYFDLFPAQAAIKDALEQGDREKAIAIARRVVESARIPAFHWAWFNIAETMLTLGMKDELSGVLNSCYIENEGTLGLGFVTKLFLAVGDEAGALRTYLRDRTVGPSKLQLLLYDWNEALYGPKARLLNVAGVDVFQDGLDLIAGTIGGQEPTGRIEEHCALLQQVSDEPMLVAKVLASLERCLMEVRPQDRIMAAILVLRTLIPDSDRFVVPVGVQREVVEVVRRCLKSG